MNKLIFKIYMGAVILMGVMISIQGLLMAPTYGVINIMGYVLLMIIAESLAIQMGDNTTISIGFAVGLTSVILFSPIVSGFVVFLGFLFHIVKIDGKYEHLLNTSFLKRIFNCSANAITAFLASAALQGISILLPHMKVLELNIIGTIVAMLVYVSLNIIIYSLLFAVIMNKPVILMIYEYKWLIPKFFGVAPLGVLMAMAHVQFQIFGVLLFFAPLLLARFTFIQYMKMKEVYIKTINSFTKAIDAKDKYTVGHSERVAEYAIRLARTMNYNESDLNDLRTAALLHDIGKIGISDEILNKPGRLSDDEYTEIKRHPEVGEEIISEIYFLKDASAVLRHHHESYDGSGYPDGLKGDEIPLEAAIITVVDAYDAMTSDRSYRKALTHEQAMKNLVDASGKQFNPRVVDAFIELMSKVSIDEVRENVG